MTSLGKGVIHLTFLLNFFTINCVYVLRMCAFPPKSVLQSCLLPQRFWRHNDIYVRILDGGKVKKREKGEKKKERRARQNEAKLLD